MVSMTREEALHLHGEAIVVDSHNDSTVGHIRRGNLGLMGETGAEGRGPHVRAGAISNLRQHTPDQSVQLNIPNMRQGGINAAFFAVDVTMAWGNHLLYAMDGIGYITAEIAHHCDHMCVARSSADMVAAHAQGKIAALLAIENSDALQRSLHVLQTFYHSGVRSITLTHSPRSWAADGCEVVGGGGLTAFGIDLVSEMNRLGMLIDVSHLNEPGFWQTLECSNSPVIASHSCCRDLCDHPRNLTDGQLKALAEHAGVVGITFVGPFVHPQNATHDGLLDHIEHAVEVAGIDHVGLGSDFDGGGDLIEDATLYPEITVGLAARGFAEGDLRKILGLNHLRLLAETID